MLAAIAKFGIDTARLHNDSTSIKRARRLPHRRRPRTWRQAHPGHHARALSKDHRPDLKQLVWILTVTADGAVPIAYRVADGNTAE